VALLHALGRSYWSAVALVSYIGVAGLQAAGFSWWGALLLLGGPLLLAWVWRRTVLDLAPTTIEPAALVTARVGCAATLAWLQSRLGPPGMPSLELVATLSAGTAAVAGSYALARIAPVPGLLTAPKVSRSLDAAAFTALLWTIAVVVAGARFLAPEGVPSLDPLTLDYATTAASIGSLLVLIAAAWRVRVLRELELGVGDRAEAAVALSVTAMAVGVPLAATDIAAPDRVLPAALLCGALACIWTVLAKDPARVSSAMRGTIAVMALGVPAGLLTAVFTQQAPSRAGVVALMGCALALLVGLIAREVARPLGPEQSRWLMALHKANESALDPDPNTAIAGTLRALKRVSKAPTAIPQLWRIDPAGVISVDVAGYLHESEAQVPDGLCQLALEEPERTLRADTLRALQVRRSDVRPLLAWYEARGAYSATLVLDEDGPTGFLLLPKGERATRMTLEEAIACRTLADRLSALMAVNSALARSRQREGIARERAEHWQAEFQAAKRVLDGQASRNQQTARALASPLLASAYSPAARLTLAEIERRAKDGGPVLLQVPTGVDVEAWAAVFHLASAQSGGPLMTIDSALEVRLSADRWNDPEQSPVELARGGTLLIKDLHLLPLEMQTAIVRELTFIRGDGDGLAPAQLLASMPHPLTDMIQRDRVLKAFEPLLKQRIVQLPTLADRPEDLRSLVLDAIARTSNDLHTSGVDRRALQALMDHPWPGNERELRDVVERAGQLRDGTLLSVSALQAAGLQIAPLPPTLSETHEAEADRPSRSGRPSGGPHQRSRGPRRPRRKS